MIRVFKDAHPVISPTDVWIPFCLNTMNFKIRESSNGYEKLNLLSSKTSGVDVALLQTICYPMRIFRKV